MLPCESCGAHCRSFTLGYPGGPEGASRCRETLVAFVLALHNEVSAHTRPGSRPWSPERAAEHYAAGVPRTPVARLWSDGVRLVRELDDVAGLTKQS